MRPGWYSLIAAAAAGVAAVIGIVRKKLDTLIGTVAAVALVPAGCAAGISLVAGDSLRAVGGIVLLLINVMLICAAGLLTIALVHLDNFGVGGLGRFSGRAAKPTNSGPLLLAIARSVCFTRHSVGSP